MSPPRRANNAGPQSDGFDVNSLAFIPAGGGGGGGGRGPPNRSKNTSGPPRGGEGPSRGAGPPKGGASSMAGPPRGGGGDRPIGKRGGTMNVNEQGDTDDRAPCRYCGRKFATDRIAKHESTCKTSQKKRTVFNSQKQRIQGTEAAQFVRKGKREPQVRQKDFRAEHQQLVSALRAAKKYEKYEKDVSMGKAKGPPPKLPVIEEANDDRIQCPGCGRKFGDVQYERHIKSCAGYSQAMQRGGGKKPSMGKSGVGKSSAGKAGGLSRPAGIGGKSGGRSGGFDDYDDSGRSGWMDSNAKPMGIGPRKPGAVDGNSLPFGGGGRGGGFGGGFRK